MQIEVLEKNDMAMQLRVEGVSVAFMNTLRRIMLSEVPCMAIDEVVIIENSSIIHDEILAHRLGLIPLRTDLESYNLPEDCSCKSEFGCNLCRVALALEVEAGENTMTVYSESLRSENTDITPVSDKIPIVKLAPNQKIRLEAYARLGKGKNHAKWQPVSACAYKYSPETRTGKDGPRKKVSKDEPTFILNIESTGALPVETILLEALNILDEKFKDFLHQLR